MTITLTPNDTPRGLIWSATMDGEYIGDVRDEELVFFAVSAELANHSIEYVEMA